MRVLGIVWTGVQTANFDAMATFLERLFGTEAPHQDPGFRLWSLPDGDIVELYAEGTKPPFGTAPVVGSRVDDLEAGRDLLEQIGAEIVGGYGPNADGYAPVHLPAPDGNIYELPHGPDPQDRATPHPPPDRR